MPGTGGGDPLPRRIRCGWCNDYETPVMRSHVAALARLESHVKESHPVRYEAAIKRSAE